VGASLTIRASEAAKYRAGFQPDGCSWWGCHLPPKRYVTYEPARRFTQNVPKVSESSRRTTAAIGNGGLRSAEHNRRCREGRPQVDGQRIIAGCSARICPGKMGIPLRDDEETQNLSERRWHTGHVSHCLINEAASALWPVGKSPIRSADAVGFLGEHAGSVASSPGIPPYVTVVGILANTKESRLRNPPSPAHLGLYPTRDCADRTHRSR